MLVNRRTCCVVAVLTVLLTPIALAVRTGVPILPVPRVTPVKGSHPKANLSISPNAAITSPVPPPAPTSSTTFKNGVVVQISGTAGGSGFQSYQVDWAPGLDPGTGFETTGVTLAGGGNSPVSNGLLASWDTSSISTAGYYTIRLTVTNNNTATQALTMIYLEPDLLSTNWPKVLDKGPYFSAGVVPAANPDNTTRLVLTGPQILGAGVGEFWTLPISGAAQPIPLQGRGSAQQPAVADLDGNPGDEAIIADSDAIEVYKSGQSSQTLSINPALDFERNQIVLADLAGDGQWETIALGSDFQNQVADVYAWRPDGSVLNSNFPIQIPDQNPVNTWGHRTRVLAADINGDGNKEIVIQEGLSPTTFSLGLFANDGSALAWNVPVLAGIPEAMVAADLDHNGKLETILVYYSGAQAIVDVFQPDGSERAGWPIALPNPIQTSESFLAVGDLKQDGRDEIVYSHETYLYVLNDDGTMFSNAWPLQTAGNDDFGYGAVVIGDVDGDGLPEIVTTLNTVQSTADPFFTDGSGYYGEELLALRSDGSISKSRQLTAANGYSIYVYPAPAIGDFNQDGMTDIAVAYEVTGSPVSVPGVVTIVTTGAKFNPALNDWPFVHHDAQDSGVLSAPADFSLSGSAPQTVNAGVSATFTITVAPNPAPYDFGVTNFACAGLPTGAACNFSPTFVLPGAKSSSTMLSVSTTSRMLALARPTTGFQEAVLALLVGPGIFGLLLFVPALRKRGWRNWIPLVLLGCALTAGCGGGSGSSNQNPNGTPAGTYTLTVSATGNGVTTHTTTVTLTVN